VRLSKTFGINKSDGYAVNIAKRSMIFSGDRLRVKTLTLGQIRKFHLHGRYLNKENEVIIGLAFLEGLASF
jgi:hypothetical protein